MDGGWRAPWVVDVHRRSDPRLRDSMGEAGAGILAVLAGAERTREGLTETWEAVVPELVR